MLIRIWVFVVLSILSKNLHSQVDSLYFGKITSDLTFRDTCSVSSLKWLASFYEALDEYSFLNRKFADDSLGLRLAVIPQGSELNPLILILEGNNSGLTLIAKSGYFPTDKLSNYNLNSLNFNERRILRKSLRKEYYSNSNHFEIINKSAISDSVRLRYRVKSYQLDSNLSKSVLRDARRLEMQQTCFYRSDKYSYRPQASWVLEWNDSLDYDVIFRESKMETETALFFNFLMDVADSLDLIEKESHHISKQVFPVLNHISKEYYWWGFEEVTDSTTKITGSIRIVNPQKNHKKMVIKDSIYFDSGFHGEQRTYAMSGELLEHWIAKGDTIFGNLLRRDRLRRLIIDISPCEGSNGFCNKELTFYKSGDIRSIKYPHSKTKYYKRNGRDKTVLWDYTLIQYAFVPTFSIIMSQIITDAIW